MTTSTDVPHNFPPAKATKATKAAKATAAVAVVVAAAAAIVADALIALIAHHLGAPQGFKPLQVGSFAGLTVIGVLAGAVGWNTIRSRARDPRRVLTRLVPAVIAASMLPDLALGVTNLYAHTTWGAVAALMLMHLAVAACAVTAFRLLMPLTREARRQ